MDSEFIYKMLDNSQNYRSFESSSLLRLFPFLTIISIFTNLPPSSPIIKMQISIIACDYKDPILLTVESDMPLAELKMMLAKKHGFSKEDQRLVFEQKLLKDDNTTLSAYKIKNRSVLRLYVPMRVCSCNKLHYEYDMFC